MQGLLSMIKNGFKERFSCVNRFNHVYKVPFVRFDPADLTIHGNQAKTEYRNIISEIRNFGGQVPLLSCFQNIRPKDLVSFCKYLRIISLTWGLPVRQKCCIFWLALPLLLLMGMGLLGENRNTRWGSQRRSCWSSSASAGRPKTSNGGSSPPHKLTVSIGAAKKYKFKGLVSSRSGH